jgi:3-deoxy-D-manno-octulosonic-acid transferase
MGILLRIVYNGLVIPLGWVVFRLLGIVDRKARRGLAGRRGWRGRLSAEVAALRPDARRIWFHSSSMGEFEQAKPIIAELKKKWPDLEVVVSFFSPSGYEHSQSYKLADVITYIPFDSPRNARLFVDMIRPRAAVIVRYDVWPNHLWALNKAGISTLIANATLREHSAKTLPVAKQLYRALYNSLDYILTVSEDDKRAFDSFRLTHPVVDVIGDTRYDQVWRRSAESRARQVLAPEIHRGKKVLVVGSSWKEDEDVLFPACLKLLKDHPECLVILVPHEPTLENLERIEGELNGKVPSVRFSDLSRYGGEKVVLIDSVGILMSLYQYAHVAYVGGSFRGGVHNVLEPAAYGIPVLFGPEHQNSQEAAQLVKEHGAFICTNADELHHHLEALFTDDAHRRSAGDRAAALVKRNTGATERFLSYLEKVVQ